MSDDYGYSQPEVAEEESTSTGKFKSSEKIHSLMPSKQQKEPVDNHILLLLFRPSMMPMFNGIVDADIRTWWMKLMMHYISAKNDNGEDYTAVVVCPRDMNTYYSKVYGRPIIYSPVSCPNCATVGYFATCVKCRNPLGVRNVMSDCSYCDESGRWWHGWRQAWEKALQNVPGFQGRDWKGQYDLKKKNPELHKQLSLPGTEVAYYRDAASKWNNSDRYLFVAWDVDKFTRRRALAEGESEVPAKKLLFQGKTVFESLKGKHRNGKLFFDPRNNMMVVLTRDTSNGVAQSRYAVDDAQLQSVGATLDQTWLIYLMDEHTNPDASDEMVVLSYDEQVRIAGLNLTQDTTATSTVQTAVPQPPVAPMPMQPPLAPAPTQPPAPAAPMTQSSLPPTAPTIPTRGGMGSGSYPPGPPAAPTPPAMPGPAAQPRFMPPPAPPMPAMPSMPPPTTPAAGFQPTPMSPDAPRRKQWNS